MLCMIVTASADLTFWAFILAIPSIWSWYEVKFCMLDTYTIIFVW